MNASWFRYFFVVSVVVGALLVSLGFHEIDVGQQHQNANARQLHALVIKNEALAKAVATSHARELHNRTSNVSVWCGAINEGRKEGMRLHRGEAAYKLKLLDCKAIEAHTLTSGEATSQK